MEGCFNFVFGGVHDLYIYDKCSSNNNSCCKFFSYNTTEQYELNGGKQIFM